MMNVPWMICTHEVLNTASTGAWTFSPRCSACWKTGVSSSFTRTQRPSSTITTEARNGMRQPHSRKGWSVPRPWPAPPNCMSTVSSRKNPLARMNPNGAPSCGHMAARARLPSSAYSVASRDAPDHSPPRPTPWQKRRMVRISGAQRPIW